MAVLRVSVAGFTGHSLATKWLGSQLMLWLRIHCRRCKRHRFDSWVGKIPWSRTWQPALVFLPGVSHGQRSLETYSPWGCKELDMAEQLNMHAQLGSISFLSLWFFSQDLDFQKRKSD